MPFKIIENDITLLHIDAIVNAANNQLAMGSGVCGAIFNAAGQQMLQQACDKIGYCETGDAVITDGFGLFATHIIHTVGPVWRGGNNGEEELLASCYTKSLKLAHDNDIEAVAFPLISSGVYGYPKEAAMKVAVTAIEKFLEDHDMAVSLVIFDRKSFYAGDDRYRKLRFYLDKIWKSSAVRESKSLDPPMKANVKDARAQKKTFRQKIGFDKIIEHAGFFEDDYEESDDAEGYEVDSYGADDDATNLRKFALPSKEGFTETISESEGVDESELVESSNKFESPKKFEPPRKGGFAEEFAEAQRLREAKAIAEAEITKTEIDDTEIEYDETLIEESAVSSFSAQGSRSLNDIVVLLEESFSEMLLRLIDEKGYTDVEVYKRANIDRKLFSKIRSAVYYKPGKLTALALAIALRLSLDETKDLLAKAGFALSRSYKLDIIVEFFIDEGNYNIYEINEALFAFGQPLLGNS